MSALIGDFEIGVQPLWPAASVSIADVFDLPAWERPTPDTGYTPPEGAETFTGTPGFGGTGGTDPSTGAPGFTGEATTDSFWSVGDGSDPNDGGAISVVGPDGSVILVPIYAHRVRFWRVEVYDEDGVRVAYVPHIISGKLQRKLDQASTLEFKVAYAAEGASDLVRPNYIVLRDRWGFVVDTFQIQRRRPIGQGDASYLEIVAQGKIAQLRDEVVLEYNGATAGITVGDHVAALLALQEKASVIDLGRIDPEIADIELPFYAADTNIHAALLQLQTAIPKDFRGRFYLDAKGKFQWRLVPGDTGEQVIMRGRNVQNVQAETDYSLLVNRVYMYGDGLDVRDRLKLTDAGEAEEYLEDAASVSTWGLSPAIKVDRRIRHADTLLRVAARILEEFATPQVKIDVDLLDLAKADDGPVGWRDIEIGGQYRVVDTPLGVDTTVEIVGIEVDFSRPVAIRVELANQTKTLGDLISDLVDSLQQPLDVDGDRYPTMGRNYSSRDPRTPGAGGSGVRAGDVRWNSDDGRAEMHNGTDWQAVGGIPLYTATSKAGLPSTGIEAYALGFITAGTQKGAWFERNAANDAWIGRTIWEVPA